MIAMYILFLYSTDTTANIDQPLPQVYEWEGLAWANLTQS